jgi:hypothetical protein
VTDPDEALQRGVSKDNGANKQMVDSDLKLDKKLNFHRYVDENLVEEVAPDVEALADLLSRDVSNVKASKGAWKDWPAQWAQESVEASRVLYEGLTFSKRYPKTGNFWMMYVKWEPGAEKKFQHIVEEQLTRAARHLADLLGSIRWAK